MAWTSIIPAFAPAACDPPATGAAAEADWHVALLEDVHAAETFWQELFETAGRHVYQHPAFHTAWFKTLGRRKRAGPLIIAVHHQGRPFLLLPLLVKRIGPLAIAVHAGEKHANIAGPLCRNDDHALITQALTIVCAHLKRAGIDLLLMQNVIAQADGQSPASSWPRVRWIITERFFEAVLPAKGLEAFFSAHRSRKARARLRHKRNRLAAVGTLRIGRVTKRAQAHEAIHTLLSWKAARLARKGAAAAPGIMAGWAAFYRALFDQGLLEIYTLSVNGRLLAVLAGAAAHGRFSVFASAFDADAPLARYSPGEVLLAHLFDALPARGVRRLDLGVGSMPYKQAWSTSIHPAGTLLVSITWRGNLAMRALTPLLALKPAAKRILEKHPRLRRPLTFFHTAARWPVST
ncbi:GNAT family N-acetyltransferase [Thermopetrobacter sp. TC1]|uniref:GNAT family N-acetyltransferase n=1 Tax=Thermopetrobacter sp. TC1 TaxID=1495045 RepID=UPI000570CF7B|nr:GNAT family N-acetyltransferase [Thermopetrobacter sp. TC1]